MRSYHQFCGVAKALDLIGDRWTLLIVRELLIRGGSRYTEIKNGLPGIATNLLADRLRELQRNGIIAAHEAPPPIATTLFSLTERGRELEPVLRAMGHWGGVLAVDSTGDSFQSHWLALPLGLYLRDHLPDGPPATIEIRTGDEPMLIEARDGVVSARAGTAERPDAVLAGAVESVIAVLLGRLDLEDARAGGLHFEGDPAILDRVRPDAITALQASLRARKSRP
jgi:DNA-binding HxlR family transcriptional regulator